MEKNGKMGPGREFCPQQNRSEAPLSDLFFGGEKYEKGGHCPCLPISY
jgi:hypothetical protein